MIIPISSISTEGVERAERAMFYQEVKFDNPVNDPQHFG
jgi:hypothetical protein